MSVCGGGGYYNTFPIKKITKAMGGGHNAHASITGKQCRLLQGGGSGMRLWYFSVVYQAILSRMYGCNGDPNTNDQFTTTIGLIMSVI